MSTASLFSLLLIETSTSINDCRYFGRETGPLIPIDVCMKWDTPEAVGAYSYQCDGLGVYLNVWDNDDCSGEASATSEGTLIPEILNCGGGVCNHIIIREYEHTYKPRENMCYKNESYNPYFEYAFVEDCWDSEVVPDRSWSMRCTANTMSLKFWDEHSCNGKARNVTKITEGCRLESDLKIPAIVYNFTNFTLPTINSNNTYFEIQGCGDATTPWLWILIICIIAICYAGCCCFCLCRYFCKKKCKECKSGKNIDPLIVNQTKEGAYTTTA